MKVPLVVVDVLGGDLGDLEIWQGGHGFLPSACSETGSGLLRVQLDDELLLDRRRDLAPLRERRTLAVSESWSACSQAGTVEISSVASRTMSSAAELGLDRDHVVGLHLVGGDVDPAAVDLPVAVADQLAGLAARGGEAEPDEDVVEAATRAAAAGSRR